MILRNKLPYHSKNNNSRCYAHTCEYILSNNFFFFCLLTIYLQVLDYTQFYLDLAAANANKREEPRWLSEYNLTTYYHGLGELSRNEISAVSLHNLADRFTNPDDILFRK